MILVTSANGKVGRCAIKKLIEKGLDVYALDIAPDVEKLKEIGVKEVIVGDMADVNVCKEAVEKCEKVYFIPPVDQEPTLCINMVNASKKAGIKHFVYHSVLHTQKSSLVHHRAKGLGEEYLIDSDINFTILSPTCYMFNLNIPKLVKDKEWNSLWPQKTSYVDPDDVAEVAVKVLTEDTHERASYELVGCDLLDENEVIDLFTKVTGIKAKIKKIVPDDYFNAMNIEGSDYFKKVVRHLYIAYSYLGSKGNPNVLTWLLGRKPTLFEDYIKREVKNLGM